MLWDRCLSVMPVCNVHVLWACGLWPNGWWIKMPLGTDVGLGPGHIVLDGDLASPRKVAQQPHALSSIVAKRLHGSGYHMVRR